MNWKTIASVTGVLVGIMSAGAMAQSSKDWVEIKNPKELRALYSNKTFIGVGWVGYYRADGKGLLTVQGQKPVPRTWQVKGNDQVCVTPEEDATACFQFLRNQKNLSQLLVMNVKSHVSYTFTLKDGVPKF